MVEAGIQAEAKSSSKLELIFILLIPFGGLALAAWMYFAGEFLPDGRSHKGNLLSTPLSLAEFQTSGLNTDMLDGKWGIIVVSEGECGQACRDFLYLTRQSHIALNRNSTRVSRFFISEELPQGALNQLLEAEHQELNVLTGRMPLLPYGSDESVRVFLADPLGNVMLWYGKEHSGKQILKDLEKLLKASRIG